MGILENIFKKKAEVKKVKFINNLDGVDYQDITETSEYLYKYFLQSRTLLLNNNVDFTQLQELDLAILRACRINLGLTLASGYTCNIHRLSSTSVEYSLDLIEVRNNKISYQYGKIESRPWSSFTSITVEEKDINIYDAVTNMAQASTLSLICDESTFKKEIKSITNNITSALSSNAYSSDEYVEVEEYDAESSLA